MEAQVLASALLFTLMHYQFGVRSCEVTVEQNSFHETYVFRGTANVSCRYKAKNCDDNVQIYWFRYSPSEHEVLYPNNSNNRIKVHKSTSLYTVLEIMNIAVQDSGLYLCGIAYQRFSNSASKVVGPGTKLTIRDGPQPIITAANMALIVICTLLFIYVVAVFSYYAFKAKWKICKFIEKKSGTKKEANKNFRARSVFQEIAKEYHNRFERKTNKQNQVIEDDTIYQNT